MKKEYNVTIPKGWNEVTISMFEDLSSAMKNAKGNPYNISAEAISVLCDIPVEEVRSWPVSALNSTELLKKLSFLEKEPKGKVPSESITLNGKQYKVCLYPQKWTAGQFLDYTTLMQNENLPKRFSKIIACFTIPKGCEYGKDYDFDKVVDEIHSHMDIETALGMANFFQLEFASFVKALYRYSEKKLKKVSSRK